MEKEHTQRIETEEKEAKIKEKGKVDEKFGGKVVSHLPAVARSIAK